MPVPDDEDLRERGNAPVPQRRIVVDDEQYRPGDPRLRLDRADAGRQQIPAALGVTADHHAHRQFVSDHSTAPRVPASPVSRIAGAAGRSLTAQPLRAPGREMRCRRR